MEWGLDSAVNEILFHFWDVEILCEHTRKYYLKKRVGAWLCRMKGLLSYKLLYSLFASRFSEQHDWHLN